MADEFTATLAAPFPSLESIASKLYLTNRYSIERCSGTDAALRFSSKERRLSWPEDFTLSYDGPTLLLTVHSATKLEREQIIRDVESALHQSGRAVSFEGI